MSRFRLWISGLLLGVVANGVIPFTWALYGLPLLLAIGLAVLAALARPRPAGLAGFLLPVGAGWLLTLRGAVESCAEVNRQPNASCQMGDNSTDALVGVLLLGAGFALSALVLRSARNARAS